MKKSLSWMYISVYVTFILLNLDKCYSINQTECRTEKGTVICSRNTEKKTGFYHEIQCINKHLHDIPRCDPTIEQLNLRKNYIQDFKGLDEYKSLEFLDLEDNNIKNIKNKLPHIGVLKQLLLHRNQISTIGDNVFQELAEIKIINLASNRLNAIGNSTFRNLVTLVKLYLGNNSLSTVPWSSFFNTSLTVLDLSRNKLTHIDSAIFYYCPNLKKLHLSYNWLIGFPVHTVGLFSLEFFDLSGNVFNCDCNENILELSDTFGSNSCTNWKPPTCLNGMNFVTLRTQCRETELETENKAILSNHDEDHHTHGNDPMKIMILVFVICLFVFFVSKTFFKWNKKANTFHEKCERCFRNSCNNVTADAVSVRGTPHSSNCRCVATNCACQFANERCDRYSDHTDCKCVRSCLTFIPFHNINTKQDLHSQTSTETLDISSCSQRSSLTQEFDITEENQSQKLKYQPVNDCPHFTYIRPSLNETCSTKTSIV